MIHGVPIPRYPLLHSLLVRSATIIDTMLVIGTSTKVYPGTAYIEAARQKGARIAVVNVENKDPALLVLRKQDWYFEGDAAVIVPKIIRPAIGSVGEMQENQQNTDLY